MCFLIPLLTGLLGALLGYLLGKLLGGGNNYKAELDAELEKNRKLSADLNVCNTKFSQTEKDYLSLKSSGSDWEAKYKTLNADFDAHKAKFATLETDYNGLKAKSSGDDWEAKYKTLNADFDAHKAKFATLETDYNTLKLASVPAFVFDGESAKSAFGVAVKEDDLKIVEGIGPKIEELFHNAGIKTWKALSELSVEKCRAILDAGGEHYQIHDPGTWPKQCELAYQGKWAELKKWQDELDAGKA